MITKKKQDEIERERSERENVRGGEREREREGKAAREKKKVTLGGVPKKNTKTSNAHLTPSTTLNGKIRSRIQEHLHPEFPKCQHLILPIDLQVRLFDLPPELYLVPPMHPE